MVDEKLVLDDLLKSFNADKKYKFISMDKILTIICMADAQMQPHDRWDRDVDLYKDGWYDAIDFIKRSLYEEKV